jgi:hypothetical protein
VEFKFDPINLTTFPKPSVVFKRSNAFVAGMLFNRIIFEIRNNFFIPLTEPLSKLKSTIAKLESWQDWLQEAANLGAGFSDWFLTKIDQIEDEARNSDSKKPQIKKPLSFPDDIAAILLRERCARNGIFELPSGYNQEKAFVGQLMSEAQQWQDSLKAIFAKEAPFFSLGLLIDGATNGYSGCDIEECYSRKLYCQNLSKKSVWLIKGSAEKPIPNAQILTSLPRSFIQRLKTSTGNQLFPFDILKFAAELPPPLQWANAIVDAWSALAKEDQEEAVFRRVELKCGEIYLDGKLLGIIPRDNNAYIALNYIVGELQRDPNQWFNSQKVYREIYKYHQLNNPKKKRASKTPSGGTEGESPDPSPDQPKRPEYGKLHKMIVEEIGEIFQKIDGLNTRKGFTLRITEFSKAVLA